MLQDLVICQELFTAILIQFAKESYAFWIGFERVVMVVDLVDDTCMETLAVGFWVHEECPSDQVVQRNQDIFRSEVGFGGSGDRFLDRRQILRGQIGRAVVEGG
jgi:hypothetical protein